MPPRVSVKFPEVVAAVREAEKCLWKIGDALIKECGPPDFMASIPAHTTNYNSAPVSCGGSV